MAPENVPMGWRVSVSKSRSVRNPPVAPANRPVPPVRTPISTKALTPGVSVGALCPTKSPISVAPSAATNSKVPVAVSAGGLSRPRH
jgi:hypothetical protein